jgi:hypothetical protein
MMQEGTAVQSSHKEKAWHPRKYKMQAKPLPATLISILFSAASSLCVVWASSKSQKRIAEGFWYATRTACTIRKLPDY